MCRKMSCVVSDPQENALRMSCFSKPVGCLSEGWSTHRKMMSFIGSILVSPVSGHGFE
jgi:hypothetical protein